ncbi:MAG: hypothetical protein KAU52_02415 [Methanosarcinales archaeon]|nr:hypothetical protein [Methanosarcinales archaeon]
MVNRDILLSATMIAMLTLSVGVAWADEVTSEINYQGRLAGSSGSPLSGTYTMTFRLYEAATGGTALDTDLHDVVVTNGLFNTELNFDQSYFDGRALWLGVKVGADSEMAPRQEFRPVPYAHSLVPGATIMGAAQWNLNVETTHASGGALRGQASATSGTNYGVVGASKSPDGYGGYFYNDGGGVGVYGRGGEYGGYFDGNVRINQPEPTIVLHDTDGGGAKARIVFENTDRLVIQGEDDADESLGVYSTFSKNRDHDAHIQVFGSATNTWGNYIEITHDGTDGIIGTDVGDILLNPAGNVGIGLTEPNRKLYVVEDVSGVAYPLKLDNPHPTYNEDAVGILFSTGGSGGGPIDTDRGKGALVYGHKDTWNRGSFHFLQEPNIGEANPDLSDAVMTIQNNGNVGIGTINPEDKLEVSGGMVTFDSGPEASITGLRIREDGDMRWTLLYRTWQGDDFHIYDEVIGQSAMTFESGTGNVGIGTTSPGAKLDVVGGDSSIGVRASSANSYGIYGEGMYGGYFTTNQGGTGWNDRNAGVNATTTYDYSNGVHASTTGYYSEGVCASTTGYNSDGVHASTTGGNSEGVYASTTGDYSEGVRAHTTGNYSNGVHASTTGKGSEGVYAYTTGDDSEGVYASSAKSYGVFGKSNSAGSAGVYALGKDGGADLILGGNANTEVGDDGKIYSDPAYSSSDIYLITNDGLRIDLDNNGDGEDADFEIYDKDDDRIFDVDESGHVYADGAFHSGGADVAEYFPTSEDPEPGTVMTIDPAGDSKLRSSTNAYDTTVAGIVSTAPGVSLGTKEDGNDGERLIAVAGRVPCKVDASYAPIMPGDLLTTSDTPGHAMKAHPVEIGGIEIYRPGTTIGKALEPLDSGTGVIEVLVTLQ